MLSIISHRYNIFCCNIQPKMSSYNLVFIHRISCCDIHQHFFLGIQSKTRRLKKTTSFCANYTTSYKGITCTNRTLLNPETFWFHFKLVKKLKDSYLSRKDSLSTHPSSLCLFFHLCQYSSRETAIHPPTHNHLKIHPIFSPPICPFHQTWRLHLSATLLSHHGVFHLYPSILQIHQSSHQQL